MSAKAVEEASIGSEFIIALFGIHNSWFLCQRDALRRHTAICQAHHEADEQRAEQVIHTLPDHPARRAPGHDCDKGALSPAPSWEHLLCQLEQDSYCGSVRKGASQSLSIFVRVISTLEISSIFDPDLASPITASPFGTGIYETCSSQRDASPSWGLPTSDTLLNSGWTDALGDWADTRYTALDDFVGHDKVSLYRPSTPSCGAHPGEHARHSTPFGDSSELQAYSTELLSSLELDPLLRVTNEIVTNLRNSVHQKPRNHPAKCVWTPLLERECFALFGPSNLMTLTEQYWNTWYIHWPVIHKATFHVCTAPSNLVAAMVLLGASYSTDADIKQRARNLADSVELMVFTDEYFGSATAFSALNAACLERRLRALQAGHAVCIYQSFEGNAIAQRRARRCRFNEVVAVSFPRIIFGISLTLMVPDGSRTWFSQWQTRESGKHHC